jgi:hypothetical protein
MLMVTIPLALSLSGCEGFQVGIQGSGVSKTETRQVGSFHALRHDTIGEVSIQIGPTQSVEFTFDDNLLEIVDTSVVDGELRIKTTDSFSSSVGLKIQVTVPSIDQLELSGVGSVHLTGFDGESLKIKQSGVGSLKVEGKTKSVDVIVFGVAAANLKELEAETVKVVVSGVGGASVFASESVDARTSGVGGIKVHGNPKEKKSQTDGLGSVSFE